MGLHNLSVTVKQIRAPITVKDFYANTKIQDALKILLKNSLN